MAPSTVVDQIVNTFQTYFTYMLPIIAVGGAIMFVASFLFNIVMRAGERASRK